MADLKISALTASTTPLAGTEVLPIVQGGATVKVSVANLTAGRAIATGAVTASTGAANTLLLTNADTFTGYNCVSLNGTRTFAGGMGFAGGDGGDPILYHIAPAGGEHSFRIANTVYGGVNTNGLFTSGNVVIQTSGKGIDFSATPGTGTSELLADYEEGTWTGTLIGSTTAPLTPVTATGKYTKIGRQVVVSISFSNVDTTGAVGNLRITGLPFTSDSTRDYYSSVIQDGFGASVISCLTDVTTSDVRFFTSVGLGNVSVSAGAGKYLWLTLTYFV